MRLSQGSLLNATVRTRGAQLYQRYVELRAGNISEGESNRFFNGLLAAANFETDSVSWNLVVVEPSYMFLPPTHAMKGHASTNDSRAVCFAEAKGYMVPEVRKVLDSTDEIANLGDLYIEADTGHSYETHMYFCRTHVRAGSLLKLSAHIW